MARRIAGVGRVTVSLRKSTTLAAPWGECNSLSGSVGDCSGIFFSADNWSTQVTHLFDEHLVRDAQVFRCEADDSSIAFKQAGRLERQKTIGYRNTVEFLQTVQIDSCKLAKPEEELFFEGLRSGNHFQLLDGNFARRDGLYVVSGIVRVSPAFCS